MKEKKIYTLDERIKYYQRKVLNLEFALSKAQERLHVLMNEKAAVPVRSTTKRRAAI